MFVCILFCGFNGTNGTEAFVCARAVTDNSSIHLDDATAATGQRRQCAHHTPATGGEERDRANQVDGDY